MKKDSRNPLHSLVRAFLAACLAITPAWAGWNTEYQFGAEVAPPAGVDLIPGKATAFLWVPPKVRRIRAVIMAAANVIERRFCDDPQVRAMAASGGVAIVFFQPGWKGDIFGSPRFIPYVESILGELADKSGYGELRVVPWIPIGHSGNSKFCESMGRMKPERTLANIVVKGKVPGVAKDGSTAGLVVIPILFVGGEFEEVMPPDKVRNFWWSEKMQSFAEDRAHVPESLLNGMIDRGHGHFDWFSDMSRYAALFLHKAIAARLDGGGRLRVVPFASGWLADPNGICESAAVADYKGDHKAAFWFFDREQVESWKPLFWRDKGKKEQLLGFTEDGVIAPWWNGWGLQEISFRPREDGMTFRVSAAFRDEVPAPFADAGTKVGHAEGGAISFHVAGWAGATEQTGPDTFRVRYDREGLNGRTGHIVIGASHEGDAQYRATSAITHFFIPINHTDGQRQSIRFDKIGDVPVGITTVPLPATVDSGAKPDFYVSWGPAVVEGDHLRITEPPCKARFPLEVKVTAYQWGCAGDKPRASATPVSQIFHIIAKPD